MVNRELSDWAQEIDPRRRYLDSADGGYIGFFTKAAKTN
jgi:hypothetical protein